MIKKKEKEIFKSSEPMPMHISCTKGTLSEDNDISNKKSQSFKVRSGDDEVVLGGGGGAVTTKFIFEF